MELLRYQGNQADGKEVLARKLDELLAEYQVYHSNLRKLHWDASLRPFLTLSNKVEHLYRLTGENQEHIANQLLHLGYQPTDYSVAFDQALMKTGVSQIQQANGFEGAIYAIIHTSHQLLDSVKEVFYVAAEMEEKRSMMIMAQLAQQLNFAIGIFTGERLALSN